MSGSHREQLGLRIRAMREARGWTQTELADQCGWNGLASRIGNYERAAREPSLDDIESMAKALGCTAKELIFGTEDEPSPIGKVVAWDSDDELSAEDYVLVPRYELNLSAGCGQLQWVVHEKNPLAFRTEFMRARRYNPANLKAMYVKGDSMEPFLQNGDTVMIDISETTVHDGQVYAVCFDDEWYIKRLFTLPGDGLILSSDNPRHAPKNLTPEQASLVRIFGKVVWRGG